MNQNTIWKRVTDHLRATVTPDDFETWFSKINLGFIGPDHVVLEVPNKFVVSWLQETFMKQIAEAFEKSIGSVPSMEFSVQSIPRMNRQNKLCGSEYYFLEIDSHNTFESFIKTKSNEFAFSSAVEVAINPGISYNPLYLFSSLSVGKTHLLNAIGNDIKKQHPSFKIGYTSADRFSISFADTLSPEDRDKIRCSYMDLDILLFDDTDCLGDEDRSQEEFVSIFDSLYEAGKQIVVAAKTPPGQVKTFHPHFRSRLEWGVLSEIGSPDVRDKMDFIEKMAGAGGMKVPDDVCFFLANNAHDFKDLGRLICRLEAFHSAYHPRLDLCTVENLVRDLPTTEADDKLIKSITSQYFGIPNSEITSNNKNKEFTYPRHIAMYLVRKINNSSYSNIAKSFCKKDHSTVINAIRRIENNKRTDANLKRDLSNLESLLT
jgi:chromosomal replication initiator protein